MTECIVIGRNAKEADGGLHFVSLITFFLKLCVWSLWALDADMDYVLLQREEKIDMDAKTTSKSKLFRYSMQLSMLRQLLLSKKITNYEYEKIKENLQRDYGIISEITACKM